MMQFAMISVSLFLTALGTPVVPGPKSSLSQDPDWFIERYFEHFTNRLQTLQVSQNFLCMFPEFSMFFKNACMHNAASKTY